MNLYEPYPPRPTLKQRLTGKRYDGTFDYDTERRRQVFLVVFSFSLFIATMMNLHLYLKCLLAGLIFGLALKSVVARRYELEAMRRAWEEKK